MFDRQHQLLHGDRWVISCSTYTLIRKINKKSISLSILDVTVLKAEARWLVEPMPYLHEVTMTRKLQLLMKIDEERSDRRVYDGGS